MEKASRLISSSLLYMAVYRQACSKALLDSYQAPENEAKCLGLSHNGKVITLSAALVHVTPLQGSHQPFVKSRNSPNGIRFCYLVNQHSIQFCSGGFFASLGMRCCFSLCWGPRITSDKNKPQTDKWEKICYF